MTGTDFEVKMMGDGLKDHNIDKLKNGVRNNS